MHEDKRALVSPTHTEGAERQHAGAGASGLDEAKGDLGFARPIRIAEAPEEIGGEILAGNDNAPKRGKADHGEEGAEDGAGTPEGMPKELAEAAEAIGLGAPGFLPRGRLLNAEADPKDEQGGDDTDEISAAPV